jgi:hypothetical protein
LRDLIRLMRVMVDLYCASYPAPPEAVTLDIDDTVDVVHGHQQLSFFNAHYGSIPSRALSARFCAGEGGRLAASVPLCVRSKCERDKSSPAAGTRAATSCDISSACADQPVEHIPRYVLQHAMKNAILMAHGVDPQSRVRNVAQTSKTGWIQCDAPCLQKLNRTAVDQVRS